MSKGFSLIEALIVIAIIAVIAAIAASAIDEFNAGTIKLNRSEWECKKHTTRTVLMPLVVGKAVLTQQQVVTQCDLYQRTAT